MPAGNRLRAVSGPEVALEQLLPQNNCPEGEERLAACGAEEAQEPVLVRPRKRPWRLEWRPGRF